MISFTSSGSFKNTEDFLKKMTSGEIFSALARFGQVGVNALAAATPVDSGLTAGSWSYEILSDSTSWSIIWSNSHVVDGRPVAIMLQYGHGTGTGGFVQGRDFINPAIRPVFDQIASDFWKAVTS